MSARWSVRVADNVLRLGEGGDFNHKTSYEEPHFNYTKNCHTKHCTATFAKPLLPVVVLFGRGNVLSSLHCLWAVPCGSLVALLHFFCLALCVGKNANVSAKALAFVAVSFELAQYYSSVFFIVINKV
jgi:hypothetical protein